MRELYYYPDNASLAPHLLLVEMQVDYALKLVDRSSNARKLEGYLKRNPSGRIPTLVHDDLVLFESPAICFYICELDTSSRFIPPLGDSNRPFFSNGWHISTTHCRRSTCCGGIPKPTRQTPRTSQESRLLRINARREFSLSWTKNLVKRNSCWVTKPALVTISSSCWRFGAKISLDQPRHLQTFCASCVSCPSDPPLKECARLKIYI